MANIRFSFRKTIIRVLCCLVVFASSESSTNSTITNTTTMSNNTTNGSPTLATHPTFVMDVNYTIHGQTVNTISPTLLSELAKPRGGLRLLLVNLTLMFGIVAAAVLLYRRISARQEVNDARYRLYSTLISGTPSIRRHTSACRLRRAARGINSAMEQCRCVPAKAVNRHAKSSTLSGNKPERSKPRPLAPSVAASWTGIGGGGGGGGSMSRMKSWIASYSSMGEYGQSTTPQANTCVCQSSSRTALPGEDCKKCGGAYQFPPVVIMSSDGGD